MYMSPPSISTRGGKLCDIRQERPTTSKGVTTRRGLQVATWSTQIPCAAHKNKMYLPERFWDELNNYPARTNDAQRKHIVPHVNVVNGLDTGESD